MTEFKTTRRSFMAGTATLAGATVLTGAFSRPAWAAYPERNIEILIPTAEGGGADRDVRIFTSVWKNHIDTNFEYAFFPGAAGQVGYEVFGRSEEHTSELQSLMRISYAVFCLKKKINKHIAH